MPSPPALTVWGLLHAAGVLACAATLAGLGGRLLWWLELPTHLRPQLAAGLFALTAVFLLGRQWRRAVWFGFFGLCNAAWVVAAIRPAVSGDGESSADRIRILFVNVHTANTRADLVLAEVRRTDPDVIVLLEVDSAWIDSLASLRDAYPLGIRDPRPDNFGIALLARGNVSDCRIVELGPASVPSVAATIRCGTAEVALLGTHPLPPISGAYARGRDRQLGAIARWARERTGPVVVVGDLNATPWSPVLMGFRRASGLAPGRTGWSPRSTWPSGLPAVLRIPLDHCFLSAHLRVLRHEAGRPVGSDHLPVLVELAVRDA